MKIAKRVLPLLLSVCAVASAGCSHVDKTDVEEVIISELDLLKNLDTKTTQKYISYKELFPGSSEDSKLSDEVNEVFSLFFQNFDYKILAIEVDKDNETAAASLRLTTIDAEGLARDFAEEELRKEILTITKGGTQNTKESEFSLEERYLTLNQLLRKNKYDSVETECTMELQNTGDKKDVWEIKRTYALENSLVGGLMTFLSDPDLLTPEDTLRVYLSTLKEMNVEEMSNYLGMVTILNDSDEQKKAIASALVDQVHKCFNYEIKKAEIDGYEATLQTEITTFDSDAILAAYSADLDEYLTSADAVIDGEDNRYLKSYDLLLDNIEKNEALTTATATFTLVNDGASWKLQNDDNALGNAIFGTLITTPVEEKSSDPEEDTFSENEEDGDYSEDEELAG